MTFAVLLGTETKTKQKGAPLNLEPNRYHAAQQTATDAITCILVYLEISQGSFVIYLDSACLILGQGNCAYTMQHNNDRRPSSSHSSRYGEGSKYPYRNAPGPMEEDINAYARSSYYDKTPVRHFVLVTWFDINESYN